MLFFIRRIVVFAILCYLCSACINLETICADTIEIPVEANFKQKVTISRTGRPDSVVFRDTFLFIKKIEIAGFPDRLLYDFVPTAEKPEDSLRGFKFPYNPLSDSVRYVISYRRGDTSKHDTLAFRYMRSIELSSPECGVRTNYRNFQLTQFTFDSLVLKTNPQTKNVSLDIYYFAP